MESRYDNKRRDREEGAPARNYLPAPDLLAVMNVERVVATKLPVKQRELIKMHFVLEYSHGQISVRLGFRKDAYGTELRRAVMMVRNSLTRLEGRE